MTKSYRFEVKPSENNTRLPRLAVHETAQRQTETGVREKRPCAILGDCGEGYLMSDEAASATIHFAGNEFFIGISPSGHAITVDTGHQPSSAPSPVELLLIALGSCTAVDVISILQKKREVVTDYRVKVSGDRREEHPRSFTRLRVHHVVKGHNISPKSVAQAIELSEKKYCSVAATLRPAAEIQSTFETIEEKND